MAAIRRKQQVQDETLIDLSKAKVSAEQYFEKYKPYILGGLGGIVLIIGGYLFYRYVIIEPRQKEAVEQMFQAQFQFERDSFDLALNNPGGGYIGFLDIIDQFGGTPAANSAHYYAGICYLNLGNFDDALKHLNKFSAKDPFTKAVKEGALGDIYSEQNQMDKAISQYKKAAAAADNDFTAPYYMMKLGQLNVLQGNNAEAKKIFEEIKFKYPETDESLEAEKYIALLED